MAEATADAAARPSADPARRASLSGSLRRLRVGRSTLAVREWGDPAGTPLLYWHALGLGASAAEVEVVTEPLVGAGCRVIAPDAPGFGASPPTSAETYRVDRLAALFWEVADACGVERAIVAGRSWGGTVAVVAAGGRPERTAALVLFDSGYADFGDLPGADLISTREELVRAAAETTGTESWERLLELLAAEGLDQPWTIEAWREAVVEQPDGTLALSASPETRGAALYEALHARPSESWHAVGAASIPTLLVLATEPPEERETKERLLPRFLAAVPATDVVRPGCRHHVFADLGESAGQLVADWLVAHGLV